MLRAYSNLLVFILQLIQFVIKPALGQQLLVRADLANSPFVHDDDLVAALDCGKPVRDDDGRPAFHQAVDGFANLKLGFGIDARGRLIEN